MMINLEHIMTVTEASQNFSSVAKAVDRNGTVVLMKNNRPKYVVASFEQLKAHSVADTETVAELADEIMLEYDEAFKALAK